MSNRTLLILASLFGFSAIALGAFGAHALKPQLLETGLYEVWTTGAHYHLVHSVALFALAVWRGQQTQSQTFALTVVAVFWVLGMVLFSGSLYLLAMGAPRFIGAITPIGGVLMMVGWLSLGVIALRDEGKSDNRF